MTALPEPAEAADNSAVGLTSDAELLERVRGGDKRAYGMLWDRHRRAGLNAARAITSAFDADDLVSEAFMRVLNAINRGNGPTAAFRPYLITTIRSVAARWGAQPAELTPDELEVVDPDSSDEAFAERFDQSLTVRAFNTLPERWQEVLWYTEAEQLPPREVAALIGIKPNAVSALAKRAKEGLRHAWVQAHIATVPADSECRWSIDRLAASTRKSLPAREQDRLDAHLEECGRCPLAAAEMTEASHRLGALILIGFLGGGAATAYAALIKPAAATAAALGAGAAAGKSGGAAGAAAGKATLVRNVSIGAGAAAAAAAVAAAVAFGTGAIGSGHRSAPTAAVAAGGGAGSASSSRSSSASASAPPADAATSGAGDQVAAGAQPAPASAPLAVAAVDTGDGLYYPIISGTGAPGSEVTASQEVAPGAGASTQQSGRPGVLRPALARPGRVVAVTATVLARSSSTTVSTAGRFSLGPLSWLQPDGAGEARVRIAQRSPSGEVTSTVVTVKLPKQTLALSAPLSSAGAELEITGAKGATVEVRFSDGTVRSAVLDSASGRGAVPVPAGATSATVVYENPVTGRFGRAQTVQLADLPVTSAGTTATPSGTAPGTGSAPGTGGSTPPGNNGNNGNNGNGSGGTAPASGSRPVSGVTVDTGASGGLYPVISGRGVSGATVYAVIGTGAGTGTPDLSTAPSAVVSNGAFRLPALSLPAGTTRVTLYQRESGSSVLSSGVCVDVTLVAPAVTINQGLLDSTADITGVPGTQVQVDISGVSLVPSKTVTLDANGEASVDLGMISVLPSITVYYVDGHGRRGPSSSAGALAAL